CEGGADQIRAESTMEISATASQPWLRRAPRRPFRLQHQPHDHVLRDERQSGGQSVRGKVGNVGDEVLRPFRAFALRCEFPRALPWALLLRPVRAYCGALSENVCARLRFLFGAG